ncbi:unnamed protein product [Choristocarpus tenellus]
MISNGSELLLLVPPVAGLVGSVVLPVLGAVPDGAIVLFSGMGEDAQSQLSVGVGALAGSTIMLLTVPWFIAVYAGRVDIDKESVLAVYKRPANAARWTKLTQNLSTTDTIFSTGVTGSPQIRKGGGLMILTAVSYLVIQARDTRFPESQSGPAFFFTGTDSEISSLESGFALGGLVLCVVLFVGYLLYQYALSKTDNDQVLEDFMEEVRRDKILKGQISLLGVMKAELAGVTATAEGYEAVEAPLLPEKPLRRLESLLRPFFDKYDEDSSGHLDIQELGAVFHDLQENIKQKELTELYKDFDSDNSGLIDFQEFVSGVAKFVIQKRNQSEEEEADGYSATVEEVGEVDDEEHEEIPEDLVDLDPDTQQFRIKIRALWMVAIGSLLVLIFSDPMVDVLSELGTRIDVSSFYISFILAPVASNASELIAAYNFALKKTSKTITISLSALQGAACMNNTFSLGVFMFLIFFRGLAWQYSAETTSILIVEAIMALISLRSTHRIIDAIIVLSLYPISLLVVVILESLGWD